MLRCSHATALRTQFQKNVALRIGVGVGAGVPRGLKSWTGALPQRTRLSVSAARPRVLGPVATRGSARMRVYSTQSDGGGERPEGFGLSGERGGEDEFKAEAEGKGIEEGFSTLKSEAVSARDPPRRSRYKTESDDPLMQVAMVRWRSGSGVTRRMVDKELRWLQDPVVLAGRVAKLMRKGDYGLAAELAREAHRQRMECTVAWNHILNHCMEQGNARAAFRFYNDMKKRGRRPNAGTYTIMLGGLSRVGQFSGLNPVRTARSIYRSMSAPNSPVRPNIIHTNAMLTVCARHSDMDTLWEIAGELPESGEDSPDTVTYSIILGAIKDASEKFITEGHASDPEQVFNRKALCVTEAKRVWSDIVYRWKKGELALDNHVVSAMAYALLEGTGDRHFYDVFALYRQAAGIPILAKEPRPDVVRRVGGKLKNIPTDSQEIEHVPFVDDEGKLYSTSDTAPQATTEAAPETAEAVEEEEEEEENFDKVFDPVIPPEVQPFTKENAPEPQPGTPSYIPVGNRDLSMILEACLAMTQAVSVGKAYWEHLTLEDHSYRIEPDHGSYLQYLRLLRVGRSSRAAVEVIQEQMVPTGKADGRAFHIALSCCRRDRKNVNVLKNANELLRLMDESLMVPDPRAVVGYLDLIQILEENPQFLMTLNGLDPDQRPSNNLEAMGRALVLNLQTVAAENLQPLITKLEDAMEHGPLSDVGSDAPEWNGPRRIPGAKALQALTRMRELFDSILKPENKKLLSEADRQRFRQEAKVLRKYSKPEVIRRYKTKLVAPTPDQVLAYRERTGFGLFDSDPEIPDKDAESSNDGGQNSSEEAQSSANADSSVEDTERSVGASSSIKDAGSSIKDPESSIKQAESSAGAESSDMETEWSNEEAKSSTEQNK